MPAAYTANFDKQKEMDEEQTGATFDLYNLAAFNYDITALPVEEEDREQVLHSLATQDAQLLIEKLVVVILFIGLCISFAVVDV